MSLVTFNVKAQLTFTSLIIGLVRCLGYFTI